MVALQPGITITFSSAIDEIVFDNEQYVIETGLRGFGIPAPMLRIDQSAGDGGIFRQTKRDIRTIDIPVVVLGDSRSQVEERLRRLSRLMLRNFNINAYYDDGTILKLEAYLAAGGETEFGNAANFSLCRWVLTVKCPQPYWVASEAVSFTVAQGTERGLIYGNSSFMNLPIADERIFGQITANNPGDVPCPVDWLITGAFDDLTLSDNYGNSLTYDFPLASGYRIYISGTNSSVTDPDTGENLYQHLSGNPKFFQLHEGANILSITGSNLDSDSAVTAIFYPRYEVIH
jgi:hypothetical protein